MKKYEKLIEFALMLILALVFSKGIFFGILLGVVVFAGKKIASNLSEIKFESPFSSVGLGALAGLASMLIRILF